MNTTFFLRTRCCLATLLFLSITGAAWGQPEIDIRLVRPQQDFFYRIYFTASCNGTPVYFLEKQQFSITQDGIPIIPFNFFLFRRPPELGNACFNAGLVFDRSNLLAPGTGNDISAAARRFVDSMAFDCHQATIVSFSNTVDIHEFLTSDTARLYAAASRLAIPGANRTNDVIDGIRTAMTEIETHGTEQLRVIIALTAGGDKLDVKRVDDLLNTMQYSLFRIFIIALGDISDKTSLERIAKSTGGRFIQADAPAALGDIYAGLAGLIKRELDEFQVFYQSPRAYPPPKGMSLQISFCNDSARAYYSFIFDPTVMAPETGLPPNPRLTLFPQPLRAGASSVQLLLTLNAREVGHDATITITDLMGRTIARFSPPLPLSSETHLSVPLPPLPQGLYFCRATIGKTSMTNSIIVSN